jgi:basic membrane protein A and related proteins
LNAAARYGPSRPGKGDGDKIKTAFVENVPETADSERVFRQLASDGYTLIFATSFGYMEPLQKVAKLFPNVKFEHVNGFKTAANISVYEARFEEGFYLIGTIAGQMTKRIRLVSSGLSRSPALFATSTP